MCMNELITNAVGTQDRLEYIEFMEEKRKAKSRIATKKWRDKNPEWVKQQQVRVKQKRAALMAELARLRAARERGEI